jgi:hypothetical protein
MLMPTTDGAVRLAGYAAVFDVVDRARDVVRRGAFASAPKSVPLLWQHDPARPIGRVESLHEDSRGLRIVARLATDGRAGSGAARDAAALLGAGALDGLSFGYRVRRSRPARGRRELLELDLLEVSLVTFPMNPLARVTSLSNGGPS